MTVRGLGRGTRRPSETLGPIMPAVPTVSLSSSLNGRPPCVEQLGRARVIENYLGFPNRNFPPPDRAHRPRLGAGRQKIPGVQDECVPAEVAGLYSD